jgi:hypothetical protein
LRRLIVCCTRVEPRWNAAGCSQRLTLIVRLLPIRLSCRPGADPGELQRISQSWNRRDPIADPTRRWPVPLPHSLESLESQGQHFFLMEIHRQYYAVEPVCRTQESGSSIVPRTALKVELGWQLSAPSAWRPPETPGDALGPLANPATGTEPPTTFLPASTPAGAHD